MSVTHDDTDDTFGEDEAALAFLGNLTGEEPAKKPADGATEGETEEVDETTEEPEAGVETPAKPPEEGAPGDDDDEVELSFGEEKRKVTVKDIKRLMEAETVVATRTAAASAAEAASLARTQRAEVALTNMVARAKANFEPYSKLNFLVLSKELDTATLEQVQKDAQAAYDAVKYYETELDGLTTQARNEAFQANQKASAAAVAALNDKANRNHIPGFGKETYENMMNFATSKGLPAESARGLVDPAALKLIHMAMLFQSGQAAAATKVAKVVKTPTRVLKPAAASAPNATATRKATDAMARLRKSGSVDDAADAFLSKFSNQDAD